jgi:hypothetical protein
VKYKILFPSPSLRNDMLDTISRTSLTRLRGVLFSTPIFGKKPFPPDYGDGTQGSPWTGISGNSRPVPFRNTHVGRLPRGVGILTASLCPYRAPILRRLFDERYPYSTRCTRFHRIRPKTYGCKHGLAVHAFGAGVRRSSRETPLQYIPIPQQRFLGR